jgi:hypothetical protein
MSYSLRYALSPAPGCPPPAPQELASLGPNWDPSQVAALQQALTQRVALIQGPPGTGKTFVAIHTLDALLRHTGEKILVVCYTNHALDQVLAALLAKGWDSMVRLGSRSKDARLEQYTMWEQVRKLQGAGQLSGAERRREWELRRDMEAVEAEVARLGRLLDEVQAEGPVAQGQGQGQQGGGGGAEREGSAWVARQQQLLQADRQRQQARQQQRGGAVAGQPPPPPRPQQQQQQQAPLDEWDYVGPFLEQEYPDVHQQLQLQLDMGLLPPNSDARRSSSGSAKQQWRRWLRGQNKGRAAPAQQQPGGWQTVPGRPQSTAGAGLLSREAVQAAVAEAGDQVGAGSGSSAPADIWALGLVRRKALARQWRTELREQWAEQLAEALQRAQRTQQELRSLHQVGWEAVLANSRVVGCTTTGAALYKQLLLGPAAPRVVLVEEAAEILEAHVLTSLGPETKHLIMIGDHKQLRPKVESYELSVQVGGWGWVRVKGRQ